MSGGVVVARDDPRWNDPQASLSPPLVRSLIQADGDIQTKVHGDPDDPELARLLEEHFEDVAATIRRIAALGNKLLGMRVVAGGLATLVSIGGTVYRWQADPAAGWFIEAWRALGGWPLVLGAVFALVGALLRNGLKLWVNGRLHTIAKELAATDNDQNRIGPG